MIRRLPPLNAVRAFETAARTESFTLAAREMLVSQGAVSRHVANLEAYLGVTLFERYHRKIRLTVEGQNYAAAVRGALGDLEHATERLRFLNKRPVVRLSLFPTIARWLIPRLSSFHAMHKNIEVQVTTSLSSTTLPLKEADFTIVAGSLDDPDVDYDRLFEHTLTPVCSPSLTQGRHPIREPKDLLQYVLLQSMTRPDDWKFWFERTNTDAVVQSDFTKFDSSTFTYQAAMDGVGIAMGEMRLVSDDLASGRLVAPLPLHFTTGAVYHLAYLKTQIERPASRAFRDWFIDRMQRDERTTDGFAL